MNIVIDNNLYNISYPNHIYLYHLIANNITDLSMYLIDSIDTSINYNDKDLFFITIEQYLNRKDVYNFFKPKTRKYVKYKLCKCKNNQIIINNKLNLKCNCYYGKLYLLYLHIKNLNFIHNKKFLVILEVQYKFEKNKKNLDNYINNIINCSNIIKFKKINFSTFDNNIIYNILLFLINDKKIINDYFL